MSKRYLLFILIIGLLLSSRSVLAYLPSDPLYNWQDYLTTIGAPAAWEKNHGRDTIVAVLDAGIDIDHPDLKFNIWKNSGEIANDGIDNDGNGYIDDVSGWNFVNDNNDPRPEWGSDDYAMISASHGTAVAGLIAAVANNNIGITGVAFDAKIMPLKVLDSEGAGDTQALAAAIDYATDNGADVINLSLVGYVSDADLQRAIMRAYRYGVVVVAAAGNNSTGSQPFDLDAVPGYPACYSGDNGENIVLAVTALDKNNRKSSFANQGSAVDLAAPGENIFSLGANEYQYVQDWSGTSFATALTSGAAALVRSEHPTSSAAEVINALIKTAINIDDLNPAFYGKVGSGLVNVEAALSYDGASSSSRRLVKLVNSSAIYFVDIYNNRHLFTGAAVYSNWYGTNKLTIKTITQTEFDFLSAGYNMTLRPGSLARLGDRAFSVATGGRLCPISDTSTLNDLYGDNWSRRAVIINSAQATDYVIDDHCVIDVYPNGTVLRYANSNDLWYIEDNRKRLITEDGLRINGLDGAVIIENANPNFFFRVGRPIVSGEENILPYALTR